MLTSICGVAKKNHELTWKINCMIVESYKEGCFFCYFPLFLSFFFFLNECFICNSCLQDIRTLLHSLKSLSFYQSVLCCSTLVLHCKYTDWNMCLVFPFIAGYRIELYLYLNYTLNKVSLSRLKLQKGK